MLANRKGIFLATIGERGVAPTGPNKLTTVTLQYQLIEELQGGQFVDIVSEGMTITGYHYLEKTDGTLNQFIIDKLKEATGWNGVDPFWLEDSMPADVVVKVELDFESYNGKDTLKVKWLNHKDDAGGGGVAKSTPQDRTAIKNKLAAKLRAASGGTPVKAPAPAGKPSLPPKGPPKAAPKAEEIVTENDAWAAFTKGMPADKEEHYGAEWLRIMGEFFPTKGSDDFTSADWKKMRDDAPGAFVPF